MSASALSLGCVRWEDEVVSELTQEEAEVSETQSEPSPGLPRAEKGPNVRSLHGQVPHPLPLLKEAGPREGQEAAQIQPGSQVFR